ncbi:hypothetical protein DL95DRAFT_378198, partial [Leptodontidium sp. 2 PMI_412]
MGDPLGQVGGWLSALLAFFFFGERESRICVLAGSSSFSCSWLCSDLSSETVNRVRSHDPSPSSPQIATGL